jgi:hypothetical protein
MLPAVLQIWAAGVTTDRAIAEVLNTRGIRSARCSLNSWDTFRDPTDILGNGCLARPNGRQTNQPLGGRATDEPKSFAPLLLPICYLADFRAVGRAI